MTTIAERQHRLVLCFEMQADAPSCTAQAAYLRMNTSPENGITGVVSR
jgi:hypothetical protein